MQLEFEPAGIRQAGTKMQESASQSVHSAQAKVAAAGGITLPPVLADLQAQLNGIIQTVSTDLSFLEELADSFRERMYQSATAYEAVENANTGASSAITKEL